MSTMSRITHFDALPHAPFPAEIWNLILQMVMDEECHGFPLGGASMMLRNTFKRLKNVALSSRFFFCSTLPLRLRHVSVPYGSPETHLSSTSWKCVKDCMVIEPLASTWIQRLRISATGDSQYFRDDLNQAIPSMTNLRCLLLRNVVIDSSAFLSICDLPSLQILKICKSGGEFAYDVDAILSKHGSKTLRMVTLEGHLPWIAAGVLTQVALPEAGFLLSPNLRTVELHSLLTCWPSDLPVQTLGFTSVRTLSLLAPNTSDELRDFVGFCRHYHEATSLGVEERGKPSFAVDGRPAAAGVLPSLRVLSCGLELAQLLVPGRPISSLSITTKAHGPLQFDAQILWPLTQGSTPLRHLQITTACYLPGVFSPFASEFPCLQSIRFFFMSGDYMDWVRDGFLRDVRTLTELKSFRVGSGRVGGGQSGNEESFTTESTAMQSLPGEGPLQDVKFRYQGVWKKQEGQWIHHKDDAEMRSFD